MAAGDILSCEVLATGWQAKVIIEGFVDGGAYNFGDIDTSVANAKLTMTVVSEGYNASGTLGTKTRYVYGTRVCQKAYPNHAVAEETESGGNVELTVALSDYVYDDDNTGAGKSGTAPTVTIASGWYTDSGTGGSSAASNATTALAVTNSSTQDYPKVIARWAVVPYQRFTSSFALEAVAFHRFAESGKPVACVKFEATDGTNSETITATAMSKSAAADSLPCYTASLTASAYTDNAVVTANFTAYPWVGDADSVLTSIGGTANALTLGPLPLLADSDDDYGVTYAYVSTSGSDVSGVASNSAATAEATPCATINRALNRIQTYNNTNYSRLNANAGVILLGSGDHTWGAGSGTATTGDVWVTITRDPDVAKADAKIVASSAGYVESQRVRIYDVTIVPVGYVGFGDVGRVIWLDAVASNGATQIANSHWSGYDLTYNTHCTADKINYPWGRTGAGTIAALIRGCSATSVRGLAASVSSSPYCVLTTTLTHGTDAAGLMWFPAVNTVIAYSKSYAHGASITTTLNDVTANDTACVCNVFERITSTTTELCNTEGDNARSSTNKLYWHNTFAGERHLVGYNHGASERTHSNYSYRYNSDQWLATKHDVFATNGARVGGWSVLYGVGWRGNNSEESPDQFEPNYDGIKGSRATVAGYTNDNSLTDSGTGSGDYTPDTGSVLIGKIATAADVVIPWDINGVAYAAGGCAGAITLAGGGGGGSRRIVVGML